MNTQVNTEHGSDLPPPYMPSDVVHCPEQRRHLPFRGRPRSIPSSMAQFKTPSIPDDTLRACVYLGETFSCPHILAYICGMVQSGRARFGGNARSWISVDNTIPCFSSHATLWFLVSLTLPVCFNEAHAHIFKAILTREFTSSPLSA